ncbi:uncharacterized protein BP01DRAFT_345176 [Aspergillus saccharolyticus JOP 1030-1]|uniref:C2 NT-type domain-containing protein n=1 Tax=Aspergillus saccharolyticus JOP 1030-1 TaxID=1450539 RepID=A0A319A7T0_9EURO|nr:hypothetical protein BP01DRAFT_345176 [Aspergillus saccharolyticus JOP 1030-1]PYH43232.1 hypothetical protein BP01DRAFT_345176 [Aspergillus saccharolyticus JOP 1030-1]
MQAFVPKNRRPKFELVLRIIDLNNVPLVTGTASVKWRLPSGCTAENHGHTDKAVIIDHRAYWNYEKVLQVRLTIDRNQTLHECELYFEIIQEFMSGANNEKSILGKVRLNLSEYVDKSDDDEGIVRRYLMQDSKINSTLKVGIALRQIEGDRNFVTPPLRSARVFGGIAGVVSTEQGEHDELGRLPSINSQSREATDMQDMYRRTLAASWNSRADDLPADKLIEELFAGSISWADNQHSHPDNSADYHADRLSPYSRTGIRPASTDNRLSPSSFEKRPRSSSSNHFRNEVKATETASGTGHARKNGSIGQQLHDNPKGKSWKSRNADHEVSEFDVREDLRSWEITSEEGLSKCPLRPPCRTNINSPLRWRNVIARLESTSSTDTTADTETNPEPQKDSHNARKHDRRERETTRAVPISVTSLGNPVQVVVLKPKKKWKLNMDELAAGLRAKEENPNNTNKRVDDDDSQHFLVKELEEDASFATKELFASHIDELRTPYRSHDKLAPSDWNDLRFKLHNSFTVAQLNEYILRSREMEEQVASEAEEQATSQDGSAAYKWVPGVVNLTEMVSNSPSARTGALRGLKGKAILAERVLRECWHLSVDGELGQLDIPVPGSTLSLLLSAQNFSFEELAALHDVKIDVSQVLGLLRITGRQGACESMRDIIRDATLRVQEREVTLPANMSESASARLRNSDFQSFINKSFGPTFEIDKTTQTPKRMFYLAENKLQADDALRTLHLAWHSTNNSPTPFSTYLPASETASINNIDPELNTPWFDRRHSWFRWAVQHEAGQVVTSGSLLERRRFFDRHQSRLSSVLLKLLRSSNFNKTTGIENPANVQESVTAAVGKCLFLRKPNLDETPLSAPQLGRLSLARTFTTDIPRAAPFLNTLRLQKSDEQQVHRIRLVPSALHAHVFPQLEVEVTANTSKSPYYTGPEFGLLRVKVVLSESKLDFLLPENGLDLRFTRHLTHDLPLKSEANSTLDALEESLHTAFARSLETSGSEVPLPAFTQISLPRYLLPESVPAESDTVTADYVFLPVGDVRGTRVHQYMFGGQQLDYSYYESGPFLPHRTTELSLRTEIENIDTNLLKILPVSKPEANVEDRFHEFYKSACNLAFDLEMARQTEAPFSDSDIF